MRIKYNQLEKDKKSNAELLNRIIRIDDLAEIEKIYIQMSPFMFEPIDERISDIKTYAQKLWRYAELWVIRDEKGSNMGMIVFYCNDLNSKTAFLTSLVILPQYRKQGLAKLLMNFFEQYVSSHGMEYIELEVADFNVNAMNLYKSIDYKLYKKKNETHSLLKKKIEVKGE